MKILLINNNPVVSRLTALSARKEDIEIDEIQEVTELGLNSYDIVFVDSDSWTKDVRDVISENINMKKSVLFYSDGDEDEQESFDITILKPFLPSEVSAVIRSVEETLEPSTPLSETEENYEILNESKKTLEDDLFELAPLETKEEQKEKPKQTQEEDIVPDSDPFDQKLADAFPPSSTTSIDDKVSKDEDKVELTLSPELLSEELKKDEKITDNKKDDEQFDLGLETELPDLDDDLFNDKKEETKPEVDTKISEKKEEVKQESPLKEEDDFLMDDLVLEPIGGKEEKSVEVSKDSPLELDSLEEDSKEKSQTQILDEVEIAKIKGILTEDTSDEISLESMMSAPEKSSKVESYSELKQEDVVVDSEALTKTLTSMPVEALRELLAGAKVSIKIKFPDSRK